MRTRAGYFSRSGTLLSGILLICGLLLFSSNASLSYSQDDENNDHGHPIGQVSIQGDLILMELNDGALGHANLFDLVGRTLRFTPEGSRYRVQSGILQWDSDFGSELTSAEVALHGFAFPFSGQRWDSLRVGRTGSIRFGAPEADDRLGPPASREGGVSIGRFEPLAEAASRLIDSAPAICVFFKPRMSGPHFVKELPDRVVITWDLTEPFGNIQDFTWIKTVNRFQAVLHRDGSIEMSYKELAAKDAIVGIYPAITGAEKPLASFTAEPHPTVAAHLDVRHLKLAVEDGTRLKVTLETRGPVLPEGDAAIDGITYRVVFDSQRDTHQDTHQDVRQPAPTGNDAAHPTLAWTVRGLARYVRSPRYVAFGPGVSRRV